LTVGSDLLGLIGQQSHKLPNVFSFFKPEYQPAGQLCRMIRHVSAAYLKINRPIPHYFVFNFLLTQGGLVVLE
jgi:hypothetical protein